VTHVTCVRESCLTCMNDIFKGHVTVFDGFDASQECMRPCMFVCFGEGSVYELHA